MIPDDEPAEPRVRLPDVRLPLFRVIDPEPALPTIKAPATIMLGDNVGSPLPMTSVPCELGASRNVTDCAVTLPSRTVRPPVPASPRISEPKFQVPPWMVT